MSRPTLTTPQAAALLDYAEAAERLNMSVRYVRRLVAERRIRFVQLGRAVRFDPADIAAHIDAGRCEPITEAGVWSDLRRVA